MLAAALSGSDSRCFMRSSCTASGPANPRYGDRTRDLHGFSAAVLRHTSSGPLWQSRCTLRSTVPARRLPAHNGPSLLCKSLARLPVSRTPTLRYVKLRKTHPWKLFLGLVQNESKAHRLISICTKPRKSFSRQIIFELRSGAKLVCMWWPGDWQLRIAEHLAALEG